MAEEKMRDGMKCEECENTATVGPWCEECYAKGVNAIKARIPPALKPIPSGRTIAEPLPISEVDKKQRKATKDYCTNTEFKCLLDGGDPKATIYNLRAMAHSCGFKAGAKYILDRAKEIVQEGKYAAGLPSGRIWVAIEDLEALFKEKETI